MNGALPYKFNPLESPSHLASEIFTDWCAIARTAMFHENTILPSREIYS
jgi:hypothetical protein